MPATIKIDSVWINRHTLARAKVTRLFKEMWQGDLIDRVDFYFPQHEDGNGCQPSYPWKLTDFLEHFHLETSEPEQLADPDWWDHLPPE